MEKSILTSTKKILGLAEDNTAFDHDVITHINTAFTHLRQLGVGPSDGFDIEDKDPEWDAFLEDGSLQNACKSFVYLKVRMLYDPPVTSYLIESFNQQIAQQEWRISVEREGTDWVDPDPPAEVEL